MAKNFKMCHVTIWLAKIDILFMWSQVTPSAKLIKMVQYPHSPIFSGTLQVVAWCLSLGAMVELHNTTAKSLHPS